MRGKSAFRKDSQRIEGGCEDREVGGRGGCEAGGRGGCEVGGRGGCEVGGRGVLGLMSLWTDARI